LANIVIDSPTANPEIEAGNRTSVRTSGNRVYAFYTFSSASGIRMEKGNVDGEPTSFSIADVITSLTGLQNIGGAIAIDSNDIIHCIYYQIDTAMGGILALRYVTFDTSTDTFGTPSSVASLDNDGGAGFYNQLGIAIDANDDPHVFWKDAFTSMGSTDNTTWYSNKTSGSWSSRVSVSTGGTSSHTGINIIIGEPTSSIGEDRPIICLMRNGRIDALYGTALNATAFTEQQDVSGSISPSQVATNASMAIDSNGRITIAFIENTSNDLMIVEHLASSAWSSWETPIDVDTSTDYLAPSIACVGTDRYIFVENSTDSAINLWKVLEKRYYFDGHNSITDNSNAWSNDANAFDGNESTFAESTGQLSSNWLEGDGTTAPASGDSITRVYGRVLGSSDQTLVDTNLIVQWRDGGTQLGTNQTHVLPKTNDGVAWTTPQLITAPGGGWTYSKLQNLESRFYETQSDRDARVYKVEIIVQSILEETADADLPNPANTTITTVEVRHKGYQSASSLVFREVRDGGTLLGSTFSDSRGWNMDF
jgi:hypothetical protein